VASSHEFGNQLQVPQNTRNLLTYEQPPTSQEGVGSTKQHDRFNTEWELPHNIK